MQTPENIQRQKMDPIIEKELGPEGVKNIEILGTAIKNLSKEKGIEFHLLLVGGNVKPEKRGKWHKDIDLVAYSPQLAPNPYLGHNDSEFKNFSDFMSEVNQILGWKFEKEDPWFFDYEDCGDGKVTLTPSVNDKPIEILPVRKDQLSGSFEEYLQKNTDPYEVLF